MITLTASSSNLLDQQTGLAYIRLNSTFYAFNLTKVLLKVIKNWQVYIWFYRSDISSALHF